MEKTFSEAVLESQAYLDMVEKLGGERTEVLYAFFWAQLQAQLGEDEYLTELLKIMDTYNKN